MTTLALCAALAFAVPALSAAKPPARNGIESADAEVNGTRIHYLRAGRGKSALVVLHGFGETSRMWLPLFDALGEERVIIAPDLRGLGDSARPDGGYDKKTAAKDIHELVKGLGYDRVDLAGHDIGLMVAYAYAAQYPNEIRRLALLEAPIPGIGETWTKVYGDPRLWHFHFVHSPVALPLVKGREALFLRHFWETMSADPKKLTPRIRAQYAKAYAKDGAMRAAFEYFKAFEPRDAQDNKRFAETKLTMPVLAVTGDHSMGDALKEQAKLVASDVTAIKLADTGHWLMEERPDETIAALKAFLQAPAAPGK